MKRMRFARAGLAGAAGQAVLNSAIRQMKNVTTRTDSRKFTRRPYRRHRYGRTKYRRRVVRKRKFFRRRTYRKGRKAVRAAPRLPRRTIYMRRRKGIRRGNKGMLNLQYRLQSGSQLPETTFTRMYFRGSQTLIYDNLSSSLKDRTWCINDVTSRPWAEIAITNPSTGSGMGGQVMYRDFWSSLYRQVLVLGSVIDFTIRPSIYPLNYVNATSTPLSSGQYVPAGAMPGYYYARVFYYRADAGYGGGSSTPIGHLITRTGTGIDETERLWPHLRDFLSDNTVTWVKDRTSLRSKVHVHAPNMLQTATAGGLVDLIPTNAEEGYSTSYELETNNRPVRLRVKFSAKKNLQTMNILRNGAWERWDTLGFSQTNSFMVRIGYIGFAADGSTSYHVPIDRNRFRAVDVNIKYFVAMRDPIPQPSMYEDVEENGAMKLPVEVDVSDDGLSDIEDDFEELAKNSEEED